MLSVFLQVCMRGMLAAHAVPGMYVLEDAMKAAGRNGEFRFCNHGLFETSCLDIIFCFEDYYSQYLDHIVFTV